MFNVIARLFIALHAWNVGGSSPFWAAEIITCSGTIARSSLPSEVKIHYVGMLPNLTTCLEAEDWSEVKWPNHVDKEAWWFTLPKPNRSWKAHRTTQYH